MMHQWLPARKLHVGLLVVWLLGIWVLLLMTHPGWLIAFGAIYTVLVTPAMAGADVIDGTEEFSFSLPPGRGPLFLTRMGIGLGFLLLTTGIGSPAMAFDLPQLCWSLFASSGITEPNPPLDHAFLYPLAVLAPVTAFSVTFTLASLAGSRGVVGLTWLGGLALAGILIFVAIQLEIVLWDRPNGWLTCVTLLLAAVLTLLWGHLAYRNKEAVIGGGRVAAGRGGMHIVLLLLGLVLLLLFAFSLFFWVKESTPVRLEAQDAMRTLEESQLRVVEPDNQ